MSYIFFSYVRNLTDVMVVMERGGRRGMEFCCLDSLLLCLTVKLSDIEELGINRSYGFLSLVEQQDMDYIFLQETFKKMNNLRRFILIIIVDSKILQQL